MREKTGGLGQYKFVLKELVIREFKRKYSRSFLGVIWSVLNPLLMMVVLAIIFTQLLGRDIPFFPLYVLTGLITIQLFTGATNSAMTTLVDSRNMLIKVKFPLEIFVLAKVGTGIVDFGFSLVAYAVILAAYRIPMSLYMLFYPVVLLCLFMFVLGISLMLSVAYVHFGDLKHLWSVATQMLMWLSAVFWPIEMLSGWQEFIARSNPMFNFINLSRKALMWQRFPYYTQILQMVIWSVVMLLLGIWVFRRSKTKILTKI